MRIPGLDIFPLPEYNRKVLKMAYQGIHHSRDDIHCVSAREVTTCALVSRWGGDLPFNPPQRLPRDLIPFAIRKGSLGPVMSALSRWGLLGLLDPVLRRKAETSLKYTEMLNFGMQKELERIIPRLREDTSDVVLFKGHDMIHAFYHDLKVRAATDADIIIREKDLPRVMRVLHREGYTPNQGNPRSRWEKGAYRIDLHFGILDEDRLVSRRYVPGIPVEEIFAQAGTCLIGTAPYLSPHPYHSLMITALHALKHAYAMDYWFMDVGTVITGMGDDLSTDGLLRTADRYGLQQVVRFMLWALGSLFYFPGAAAAVNGFSPGPLVRRSITAATEHTRFLQFGTLLMGCTIDGFWKRLRYVIELAGPKRAVLKKERGAGSPGKIPGLGLHGERFAEFFRSLGIILRGST
jgi:hypothetical protein